MDRIERLNDLIPKLKANKKILPLKIESLEWELKFLESEKKQLNLTDVSQRRGLLINFTDWAQRHVSHGEVAYYRHVDDFLKSNL